MTYDEVRIILSDSARFFSFLSSLKCPTPMRELKRALGVGDDAEPALVYARLAHAWVRNGGAVELAKSSKRLSLLLSLMQDIFLHNSQSLVRSLFGEKAAAKSNLSLILWCNTHGYSTSEPEPGDLVIERVGGRRLDVGLVLDYDGQVVTLLRPGGELERMNAGTKRLVFASPIRAIEAREAENTQAPGASAQESIS